MCDGYLVSLLSHNAEVYVGAESMTDCSFRNKSSLDQTSLTTLDPTCNSSQQGRTLTMLNDTFKCEDKFDLNANSKQIDLSWDIFDRKGPVHGSHLTSSTSKPNNFFDPDDGEVYDDDEVTFSTSAVPTWGSLDFAGSTSFPIVSAEMDKPQSTVSQQQQNFHSVNFFRCASVAVSFVCQMLHGSLYSSDASRCDGSERWCSDSDHTKRLSAEYVENGAVECIVRLIQLLHISTLEALHQDTAYFIAIATLCLSSRMGSNFLLNEQSTNMRVLQRDGNKRLVAPAGLMRFAHVPSTVCARMFSCIPTAAEAALSVVPFSHESKPTQQRKRSDSRSPTQQRKRSDSSTPRRPRPTGRRMSDDVTPSRRSPPIDNTALNGRSETHNRHTKCFPHSFSPLRKFKDKDTSVSWLTRLRDVIPLVSKLNHASHSSLTSTTCSDSHGSPSSIYNSANAEETWERLCKFFALSFCVWSWFEEQYATTKQIAEVLAQAGALLCMGDRNYHPKSKFSARFRNRPNGVEYSHVVLDNYVKKILVVCNFKVRVNGSQMHAVKHAIDHADSAFYW